MSSGRDALHDLDAAISDLRARLARASNAAGADASRAAAIDQRELAAYRALADLRIDFLRRDGAVEGLTRADAEARALLAQHETRLAEIANARDRAAEDLARLEGERRAAEADHLAAVERHETAVAATLARLNGDPEYERRAAALAAAEAVARRAAQKLETARADRIAKGAPYEADPLFEYLRQRGYGAPGYRAAFPFSALDRWVADLIGYRAAKLNYDRLLEIPERLAEHVARVDADAARVKDELEDLERAALVRDGVEALRDAAAAARARLEALDQSIARAEAAHREAAALYSEAAAGRAGPLEGARAALARAFSARPIPELKTLAAETAGTEDDRIVGELIAIKRERLELEDARVAEARALEVQRRQLHELEELRRRFKSAKFDSPYSEFPGENLVGALMAEFLRGAIASGELWRRIERGHRLRRRQWEDDFGGEVWRDPLGRPRMGRWGEGASPSLPGPGSRTMRAPRLPGGGIRSGGGFRTGGGFKSGGGFRTGGGF